jgi:hypothetical protein
MHGEEAKGRLSSIFPEVWVGVNLKGKIEELWKFNEALPTPTFHPTKLSSSTTNLETSFDSMKL